jgi:hypothetical protein
MAALVLAGGIAASAATTPVPSAHNAAEVALRGGETSVTTGTGIAKALLANDVVPIAIGPGAGSLKPDLSAPAVQLTFPVTGGKVSLSPLAGNIDHRGGIFFYDTKTGHDIAVSDFIISLKHADLTGIVNGNSKARVVLFRLNLAHAKLRVHGSWVTASHIGVSLTRVAASALDATLGTKLFTAGLAVGTAVTKIKV